MLVQSAWTGVCLALYKKKTSRTDIRRTPDVKLRLVGFDRFVGFNFSQIQLLRFIVVIVQWYRMQNDSMSIYFYQ